MRTTDPGDAARIELLLAELRLPAIKLVWASLAAQADKEGWPAGRFPAELAEHEICRAQPTPARTPPRRSPVATRQDPRQLRLRGRPSNQQGTGHGTRRRRRLVEQRGQFTVVWAPRRRKKPPCGSARLRSRQKRLARAVPPHHRSGPAAANCASRARA